MKKNTKKVLEHDNKYKSILIGIRKKDYSKYKFEGKIYNKRRI